MAAPSNYNQTPSANCNQMPYTIPSYNNTSMQINPQEVQKLREKIQQLKDLQQQMQSLLSSNSGSIIGSMSLANSGKPRVFSMLSGLSSSSDSYNGAWISDSGATRHMTPIFDAFVTYKPFPSSKKVQTADQNSLTITRIGSIMVEPIGLLTHALEVPNLFVSSMSVQKVANYCYIELYLMILMLFCAARYKGVGLDWLRWFQEGQNYLPFKTHEHWKGGNLMEKVVRANSEEEKLLLTHWRLGHPLFSFLKEMYLNFFGELNIENMVCDAQQLAKLKRTSYPVVSNRCQIPF